MLSKSSVADLLFVCEKKKLVTVNTTYTILIHGQIETKLGVLVIPFLVYHILLSNRKIATYACCFLFPPIWYTKINQSNSYLKLGLAKLVFHTNKQ